MGLIHRLLSLFRHARPWISKTEKDETSYGVQFEFDWTDPHLPASPENFEAANPAASSSNKK